MLGVNNNNTCVSSIPFSASDDQTQEPEVGRL